MRLKKTNVYYEFILIFKFFLHYCKSWKWKKIYIEVATRYHALWEALKYIKIKCSVQNFVREMSCLNWNFDHTEFGQFDSNYLHTYLTSSPYLWEVWMSYVKNIFIQSVPNHYLKVLRLKCSHNTRTTWYLH